jgi:HNH endonuclease
MIYKKACLWCWEEMTRTRPSEAARSNWRFCSASCRLAFRNCISGYGRRPKSLSEIQKIKAANFGKARPLSRRIFGPLHWNWQGGKTSESLRLRHSALAREWRIAVFKRDNYTCQDCGARNGNGFKVTLNADHIKPWAYFPELRYEVSNGKTLCLPCHKKTPTFGYKAFLSHQKVETVSC